MSEVPRRSNVRRLLAAAACLVFLAIIVVIGFHRFPGARRGAGVPTTSPSEPASVCADNPPRVVRAKFLRSAPYPTSIDPRRNYEVRLATSCGTMYLKLFPKQSPIAVNNFVNLAKHQWFTGTYFFRIVKDLGIIQAGDPTGTGSTGPGYTIPDDAPNGLHYQVGSVVMWRGGAPDSAGSQFFIITDPDGLGELPHGLTVFGQLREDASLQVARKIQSVPVQGDKPLEKVWILGARAEERP